MTIQSPSLGCSTLEITGGNLSLAALRTIGFTGRPWPLIEGDGRIYGMYVLTRTEEGRTEFDQYGRAKKIEFTLTLSRASSDFRENCNHRLSVMCCQTCAPVQRRRSIPFQAR